MRNLLGEMVPAGFLLGYALRERLRIVVGNNLPKVWRPLVDRFDLRMIDAREHFIPIVGERTDYDTSQWRQHAKQRRQSRLGL